MKVLIKQFGTPEKVIGQFHITKDEFVGFLMSHKKVLKQVLPPELQKLSPIQIHQLCNLCYDSFSKPPEGYDADLWIYEHEQFRKKSFTKIWLENYLPHQVRFQKKEISK